MSHNFNTKSLPPIGMYQTFHWDNSLSMTIVGLLKK